MSEQFKTAQSIAYMQLASWAAQMEVEGHGQIEMMDDTLAVFHLSPAAADAFGFEENNLTPRLHTPKENEEFFNFAPWQNARIADGKYLELFAGPDTEANASMKVVFPVSHEAAQSLEKARFLLLTGAVDNDGKRFERPVMMTQPVTDE